MPPILRVRDENGKVIDIPAIVGPPGPQGPPGPAGSGTGDMVATMYDPQGKRTDIFKYVDDKTKDIDVDVTADEVTFADGQTFQQKYDSGDLTGPRGPEGPQGEAGPEGPQGPAGANGANGAAGASATINGVNALNLTTGSGLSGSQSGNTYTLSLASHKQAASTITAGTFGGQVVAKSDAQAPGTSLLRNSKLVSADTNPSNNGEINWTYG